MLHKILNQQLKITSFIVGCFIVMATSNQVQAQMTIGTVSYSPNPACEGQSVTITIDITNNTGSNINGFTNYVLQTRWDGTGAWSNSLNIGQSSGNFPNGTTKQFTFIITAPAAGSHTLNIRIRDTNVPSTIATQNISVTVSNTGPCASGGGGGGGTGTQPSDKCEDAPLINTTGTYTGNTGNYTADSPNWLNNTSAFGGGTIESSAYYKFVANSTSVTFTMCCMPGCDGATGGYGKLGVQAAIISGTCYNIGSVSQEFYVDELVSNEASGNFWADTDPTDAGSSSNNNLGTVQSYSNGCLTTTLTGLTIGDTYYIVVDGFEGDDCPYSIQFGSGIELGMKLLNFHGKAQDDGNLIEWETESEINNDYFILESSKSGADFTPIAQLDGAGNSAVALNYSVLDRKPVGLVTYYRLKQVDFNGATSYSEVISVKRDQEGLVSYFPNPVQGTLFAAFNAPFKGDYSFEIRSIQGALIQQSNYALEEGTNQLSFDLFESLASGLYFIKISTSKNETISINKIEKR